MRLFQKSGFESIWPHRILFSKVEEQCRVFGCFIPFWDAHVIFIASRGILYSLWSYMIKLNSEDSQSILAVLDRSVNVKYVVYRTSD
uniref:Uncharacterized protein n=1 Tax=Anguilla anguilla TaxID=7936 RepID=A0A0E9WQN7_ANGAN